jgi:hypothetical protein
MSTKIGHFEISSELSKSATGTVYKATDSQTNQTVALKAIQLSAFGEYAAELEKCLIAEAETTKALSHANLAPVHGASNIDGQFCAAMEYIQGNSIATMLSRKEGFSIWDLLDIGRQVCSGLDHAQSQKVIHYSLEPAKIMCGWDGTVRILSYGVSGVGKFTHQMPDVPLILHYMSPEQVSGEEPDGRSNLFSLGAIFYEMVTDSKAFNGADADALRQAILECVLPAPKLVNPKVHPGLSDLIMKAVAKDPGQRYQSGRELLDDLEKCKESKPQAAKAAPAKSTVVPDAVKAANQAKFVGAAAPKPAASVAAPVATTAAKVSPAAGKAATVAASAGGRAGASPNLPKAAAASPFAGSLGGRSNTPSASMSSAVEEAEAPKIAVDPMMAGDGAGRSGGGVSFSEMTELPPLKEVYIAPTPSPASHEQPAPHQPTVTEYAGGEPEEQPKAQTREVAQKAIKEIKNVPPQLMVYSIAAAAVLILIIAIGLVWHINSLNSDGDTSRAVAVAPAPAPAPKQAPAPVQPVQAEPIQPVQPVAAAPEPTQIEPAAPVEEPERAPVRAVAAAPKGRNSKKKGAVAAVAAALPGQMMVESTPAGAQVQVDGRTDPSWVTPFTVAGLAPGQHSIIVSKAGFSSDSRSIDVTSGNRASVQIRLSQMMATLAVSSTPAGASVLVDGKNTSKVTPAQISVDKGQHVIIVRKTGYIDESTTVQSALGETTTFSPMLRVLGNTDDIKTVGKMKKLFGGKETQGMGTVSVKTQPKGAQVAVNEHMLDKDSPVDFALDPGNYIIDITLTGYAPIHKVVTVDKGGKAVIDEVMQRE